MRASLKQYVVAFLLLFVVLSGALFFMARPRVIPPLPFDPKVFISTTPPTPIIMPPQNASMLRRIGFFLFNITVKLQGRTASSWSFPGGPKTGCSIQGLLNQCAEVTDARYLMPLGVAAGVVQFGNTNTLTGPQWVAAFEKELQTGDVQYWDAQTKRMRREHLVLLRFPEEKTTVVLPESGAADFQRTNGIQMPKDKVK